MKATQAARKYKRAFRRLTKRAMKSYERHILRPLRRAGGTIDRVADAPLFSRLYVLFALLALASTTLFWSILGARINQHNADQLVNALLFEKPSTLHEALIPSSHSFLLKWPVFYLIKTLGFSLVAYVTVTVSVVLFTVGFLAFILYKIERRPIIYGTILLAISSSLLLIPTSSYAGALLPVNMAMIPTRNIEYIIYIFGLFMLVRTRRIRSWNFGAALAVLTLLMASDKLFVSLSLGGAMIALTIYGLARGWNLVGNAARWIVATVTSAVAGAVILSILAATHIINLAGQGGLGPYGVVRSAHDLVLGCAYAVLHLFTNIGANPASQTTLLNHIPHDAARTLFSIAGLGYVMNFWLGIFAVYAVIRIVGHSIAHNKDTRKWLNNPAKLTTMLAWTVVAALAVFVVSNHYYAADARYIGIAFFCLSIGAATYISRREYPAHRLAMIGVLLTAGMLLAIPSVLHAYHQDQARLQPYAERNDRIAAILKQHPAKIVIGDYWRVIPLKSEMKSQAVMPMATCTVPRDSLTSGNWNADLAKTSFAYVLSLDAGLTDFPQCSLDQIITAYGRPNASVIVAGSVKHPQEMMLFYDSGSRKDAAKTQPVSDNTVRPIELSKLTGTACRQPTIMNIVAHQDDDLLFINPDTLHDLQAGNCVRTVYVTAGDAGANAFYWLSREQASQAAYAKMLGQRNEWIQQVVRLGDDAYATIASLRGDNKVSLVYMHLPDGNLHGQGFASHHNESLAALLSGKIPSIHDVYNNSAYTLAQMQSVLTSLMQTYQPTEIRTQAHVTSDRYPDHSDHMAVGTLAQNAYAQYETEHFANQTVIPIKFYVGYPIHEMPSNLPPEELTQKEEIFSIYSQYDASVCHSITQCQHDPAYGAYLPREYQNPY